MPDKERKDMNQPRMPRPNYQIWIILALVAVVVGVSYFSKTSELKEVPSSRFEDMVQSHDIKKLVLLRNEQQVNITLTSEALRNAKYRQELEKGPFGINNAGPHYKLKIGSIDQFDRYYKELKDRMPREQRVDIEYDDSSDITGVLFNWGFLFLLLFGFWLLMRRMTGGGGPGGQIFNIGKSKAALFDAESKVKITFEDAAGLDEAKVEIMEIVEFLKNPSKFTKLGGKIPKGALLVGAPGTGKTLLAKAVAGEAGVPFFSLSGSDFVEM
ncbi:MAG: AAA family ATPase, partial [Cyclobacteriaceae bacterium]|nr:AAA family ATPase [Cyclobacteriaceae bacterium]